jgi:FkbM family methyltransferase
MIAWDVGANVGFYSCLMSQIIGSNGHVFAFEPNPDAFAEMKRQLDASGRATVTAFRVALTEIDDEMQMLANSNYTPLRN